MRDILFGIFERTKIQRKIRDQFANNILLNSVRGQLVAIELLFNLQIAISSAYFKRLNEYS